MFRFRTVYVLLFVFCGSLLNAVALELQSFLSGLSSPIYVTSAKDGTRRIFVVERGGRIKVVQPDSTSTAVFLDIASRMVSGGEQGLLGLAFHPNYPVNRRFFVNYTRRSDDATVIAEYQTSTTNRNVAATNEIVLLVIAQPFSNHNGGMIEFGPDGYLYIGMGDGGDANDPGNRAQNINNLLGKMLRIDVNTPSGTNNYSSPPDNPYFGAISGRDEIFALGLRNPWRWSFDRGGARQLYLGDVGQGDWEEIDIITLGGNYGWRIMEGDHCNPNIDSSCTPPQNHVPPIAEWGQTNGRCTVIGGYVYRGARGTFPEGAHISADHCTGEIFELHPADRSGTLRRVLDTDLNFTSFGEDEAGEHYVAELDGTVQRLVPSPPPAACTYGVAPATHEFGPDGGSGSAAVTAGPTCAWLAASHADWITITSGASGVGANSVNFTVASNTSPTARTGVIFAAGRAIEVTQSPEVRIHITRSGNNVVLSWPTNATGFILESTSSLFPQNWQPASVTPAIIGGNYVVTNGISQAAEFYRLKD